MARTHATPHGEIPFTAEEEAAQDALEAEWVAGENDRSGAMARAKRNAKLAETDWTASSDVTMSDAITAYRQALRDVPAQSGFPSDVTWPAKPEE